MAKRRAIKSHRSEKSMQVPQKESALAKRAKKYFGELPPKYPLLHGLNSEFLDEPKVVQSYTVYSLGELPILDFNPTQQ